MSDSLQPMDCSLPGSSVHGTLQARILEWVSMPFSRGSSWPRDPKQWKSDWQAHFQFCYHRDHSHSACDHKDLNTIQILLVVSLLVHVMTLATRQLVKGWKSLESKVRLLGGGTSETSIWKQQTLQRKPVRNQEPLRCCDIGKIRGLKWQSSSDV